MTKDKTVFGIYPTRGDVEKALEGFRDAGFSDSDISVLLLNQDTAISGALVTEEPTKAAQGAAVGAGSGAAVGCTIGWLVGVGALVIPGIGPVIAAGPLVAALAGIGVGGALGGFTGSLVGLGVSENEASHYEGRLSSGAVVVAIHCQNAEEIERARDILEITCAQNISSPVPISDRKTPASRQRKVA